MSNPTPTYPQGHSPAVTSTHAKRTVANSATFLLPYLAPHHTILDIGCGPGSITSGFCTYVPHGSVTGIDLSADIISTARSTYPLTLYPNLIFEYGNIITGLRYPASTFDIIYAHQTLLHLPNPIIAIGEMHRLLRPGGILALRDTDTLLYHPPLLGLQLYSDAMDKMIRSTGANGFYHAREMHMWAKEAGFALQRMKIGGGLTVFVEEEERRWMVEAHLGRIKGQVGDEFRRLGVDEKGRGEMVRALQEWMQTEGAWYGAVQCEVLCWK